MWKVVSVFLFWLLIIHIMLTKFVYHIQLKNRKKQLVPFSCFFANAIIFFDDPIHRE